MVRTSIGDSVLLANVDGQANASNSELRFLNAAHSVFYFKMFSAEWHNKNRLSQKMP